MPFIPPMSIARSVSGLTGKDSSSSSLASMANKGREDKSGSVKERITLNLKNLGKKTECSEGVNAGAEGRRRLDKPHRAPKQQDTITTTRPVVQTKVSQSSVKGTEAELRSRLGDPEETHFTLTLTPEAVLLLQRKNSERPQRVACGGATEAKVNGRRRDNPSKRPLPGVQRCSTALNTSPKISAETQIDIRSILKVSLLNDRHKYDDVEYEEEDYTMDQRVVLKCTEWLRGLESPLTTVAGMGVVGSSKGRSKNC